MNLNSQPLTSSEGPLAPETRARLCPYIGFRVFRIIALGVCQRKIRLDSFLSERFLVFLFSDRLCYMTVWFTRAPRLSSWVTQDLMRIYRGRRWKGLKSSPLHKGQRLGVFARTRILAIFQQAKTRKKRAKASAAKASAAASQQRLEQLKRFKGKSGKSAQGLRVVNKALLGSKWVRGAMVESVD